MVLDLCLPYQMPDMITWEKNDVLGAGGAATAICTQAALDGVSDIDIFQLKLPEEFDRALAFADRRPRTYLLQYSHL